MKWGMAQILILLSLITIAVSLFNWLDTTSVSGSEDTSPNMADLEADYFLEQFNTVRYDLSGNPEYILTGDSLLHYPSRNASELIAPTLLLQRSKQPSWTLESNTGWFEEDDESLQLQGDVFIVRGQFEDQPPLSITASQVTVRTRDRTVESKTDVEIHSRDWVLRSRGFKSDLNNGKLSLLSNVRARYENTQ